MKVLFTGQTPTRATELASGFDIALSEPVVLKTGEFVLGHTGLYLAVPPGVDCQLRARSSLYTTWGCVIPNAIEQAGTIDADYRGEVRIPMLRWKEGRGDLTIPAGTRVAQLVFVPLAPVEFVPASSVAELGETGRGSGGYGSTGQGGAA